MKRIVVEVADDADLIAVMHMLGESVHSAMRGRFSIKREGKPIGSVTFETPVPADLEFLRHCGIVCENTLVVPIE
jgi:hypothetical protein